MSNAWGWFIALLVGGNIIAALWLLWANTRTGVGIAGDNTTGHRWDVDLTELNNPLPRWWLWMFIISVIFGIGYLALYPGIVVYPGALHWTETGQHAQEVRIADADAAPRLRRYAAMDLAALARDREAMAMARNIFANTCTGCHGSDARGAIGFPNLTDDDWLFGNAPDTVVQTISEGRIGVMPPWQAVVGAEGVNQLTAYVMSLSGRPADAAAVTAGAEKFRTFCVACHGLDAKGNQTIGAPNLTDNIWLYGGDEEAIRHSIAQGRQNQMPAHAQLLGPERVRLLAAYVLSLSQKPAHAAKEAEGEHDRAE